MLAVAPHSVTHLPIAAYVCTEEGAQIARSVVDQSGVGDAGLKGGGLSGAARLCADTALAKTVLTEMGKMSVEDACECVREIRQTGAQIIVLGHDTNIATYRALRQSGAAEYFQFPVSAEDILQVQPIQSAPAANDHSPITARAFTLGVIGATGGVGASVLAQNLAFCAARSGMDKTALIDADIMFGSQSYDLNCKSTPGFIEALASPERVDATLLGATMEQLTDNLSLYSHHINSASGCDRLSAALPTLMRPLRHNFQNLILDLPRRTVLEQSDVLDHLDAALILLPAGYSGVSAAARLIAKIKRDHPDLPVHAILSNVRKDAALSQKEIAQALGLEIGFTTPRSDASIFKAQAAGKSVVTMEPRSAYSKAVSKLWQNLSNSHLASAMPTTPRKGMLRRIFS